MRCRSRQARLGGLCREKTEIMNVVAATWKGSRSQRLMKKPERECWAVQGVSMSLLRFIAEADHMLEERCVHSARNEVPGDMSRCITA